MAHTPVVPLRAGAGGGTVLLRHAIGAALRRERWRQRRTLDDVALRAGVSVQYLSEIERGRKEPSSEVLAAVCTSLGGRLVDLVGAVHMELSAASPGGQSRRQVPSPETGAQLQLLAA